MDRRLVYIPIDLLAPSPEQPRQDFGALEALADSIRQYGLISPLTVRRTPDGWQLVAGERRLRAARMAGLTSVPCVTGDLGDGEAALVALVENLQREDLSFVEEARGIARLMGTWGLTQEETARRLGRSQSAIANKLRILRLSPGMLDCVLRAGLTERHARALLRLDGEAERLAALETIVREGMSAARTEAYIASLAAPAGKKTARIVVRDVRIFYNTLNRSLALLRSGGVDATVTRTEEPDGTVLTVRIPHRGTPPRVP